MEITLSDGKTILDLPDDTPEEAMKNYVERAEFKLNPRGRLNLPGTDAIGRAAVSAATGIYDLPAYLINKGAEYAGPGAGDFRLPLIGPSVRSALGIPEQPADAGFGA